MLNPCRHKITIVSDFEEQFSRSVGKLLQNYVVAVILKFWFLLDSYRWAWILFNITWLNQENLKRDDTFVFSSDKRYLFLPHIHGMWINLWMRWTFLDGLPEGVDLSWLKCIKDLLGFRSSRSRSQRPVHLRKKSIARPSNKGCLYMEMFVVILANLPR